MSCVCRDIFTFDTIVICTQYFVRIIVISGIIHLTDATHSSVTAKQQVPEFNFNVHQQLTYTSVKSSTVFVVLHDELVYAYPLVETDCVPEAVSLETRVDTLSARRLVALVAVSTQLVRR